MAYENATRDELLAELERLRQRVVLLEARTAQSSEDPSLPEGSDLERRFAKLAPHLRRPKNLLQGILNSSTLVSVICTDPDQNILFWNTGAERIFGYSAEEAVGSKITMLYPPDALTKEIVDDLRALVQKETGAVHRKMRQVTKDGRTLTISLAISPMSGEQGTVEAILGMGLDVTEEVRQHEEVIRLLGLVKKTQDVSIMALAKLAESRDEETGAHLLRMREYCRALCEHLVGHADRDYSVSPSFTEDLVQSSVLHDIGKVAIPDSVLLSPEKFCPEDRRIMNRHTVVGGDALKEAVATLGEESFLTLGMEVAYHHHEHWDGAGYPFGLVGAEIPLSARIVAIADVYDALTTERRYKPAFNHNEAASIIIEGRGKHFDPVLVDVFVAAADRFREIRDAIG